MIKLRISIIQIFILCALMAQSQTFTFHGKVIDEQYNPIEFASVSCLSQGKTTVTSLKGEFTLLLQSADSVVIKFSMIGYKSKKRVLRHPHGKQTLQVMLTPINNTLGEVLVKGERIQTEQTQYIKAEHTKNMPSATENIIEDLIKTQAGVSSHNELSSQYNVRGGAFDENSVYINNIEIYRPFLIRSGQQEGLSIINPDMVENIGFSTGGFAAKYGDKMSSALDITYRRPKYFEANIATSLLGTSCYVGFKTKTLSWSNAFRYKTNKYLLGSLETEGEYKPKFLDYQSYMMYTPTKHWKVSLIGNISDNQYLFAPKNRETSFGTLKNIKLFKVYFAGQEKDRFITYFGSLDITHNFSDSTSVSLLASAFSTNEQEKYDIQGQYWLTQTETSKNLGIGTYFQHARNYLKAHVENVKLIAKHTTKNHQLETGLTYKIEHIMECAAEYEMRDSSGYTMPHTGKDLYMIYSMRAKNSLSATRVETYIQDTYRFTNKNNRTYYTLNYGVRTSNWSYNKEFLISPRLSLGILPAFSENITFRLATGLYYQTPFYKEIRDTTTINGMTYANLNSKVKSQRSIHFIAGMDYRFKLNHRPFKFTTELYYKALSNLIPYSINNVKVVYYGGNMGAGHAMGLDLKLYGEFVPGRDSWISLSLMDAHMKLNGKTVSLPTNQRYAVNLYFTDYFPGTDRWKMSLKLAFADGLPFSAPHKELELNTFRAPAYKRVDIGMSYRVLNNDDRRKKSIFKNIWLGIDALNLFGISNVNSYYWITDVTNHQYAVPNYLTGRRINSRILFEF